MGTAIKLNGLQCARLLAAFQAMDMTAKYGGKAFGVSNRRACQIVEELTGVKPVGPGRGRIQPQPQGDGDILQQYMNWLANTGKATTEVK